MGFASIFIGAWRKVQADARRDEKNRIRVAKVDAREAELIARVQRLLAIEKEIQRRFTSYLVNKSLSETDGQALSRMMNECTGCLSTLNLNALSSATVSRYATYVKRYTLLAIKLCQKYHVYSDISTVEFATYNKMLVVNGENLYDFG